MSYPHHKGSENPEKSQFIHQVNKEGDKKKVIIEPRALDIIWGKDSRYWRLDDNPRGPAELVQVCWLEVNGSISLNQESLYINTDYALQFELKLNADAFGWNENPIYIMTKVGKNAKPSWTSVHLSQNNYGDFFSAPNDKNALKFKLKSKDEELIFGLYEVWSGRWKGGLVIKDVVISSLP